MDFVELRVVAPEAIREILIAELFAIGFPSFQEVDDGFIASIDVDQWDADLVKNCLARYEGEHPISYKIQEVAKSNWNEVWESNFDPVIIGTRCIVKAPFHQVEGTFDYEIVIMPKMSFGTGHHATTSQMLAVQMELDHHGKSVLDVGTGTGILAIMALKRGAETVMATDIDDWCRDNSLDNLQLNGYDNIPIQLGAISDITFDQKFDIILANINKNVLQTELKEYVELLRSDGHLLISGFYTEDVAELVSLGEELGLSIQRTTEKDNWACIQFHLSSR